MLKVLNSLLQEKTFEKFGFFKNLKDHHFLQSGHKNIHFKPVFRYLGAITRDYNFINTICK